MCREKCKDAGHFPLVEAWVYSKSSGWIIYPARNASKPVPWCHLHQHHNPGNRGHRKAFTATATLVSTTRGSSKSCVSLCPPVCPRTHLHAGIPQQRPGSSAGFVSPQAAFPGGANTYHKRVVGKAVSSLQVLHEVSTPVIWVPPWHWGTNWANLQGKKKPVRPQWFSALTLTAGRAGQGQPGGVKLKVCAVTVLYAKWWPIICWDI